MKRGRAWPHQRLAMLFALGVVVIYMWAFRVLNLESIDTIIPSSDRGQTVYAEACARCHGAGGEGIGRVPPFRGKVLAPEVVAVIVRVGRGYMPRFPDIRGRALDNLSKYVNCLARDHLPRCAASSSR
ncbi:MAG: c-type cytochrome [Nitrospinota bacterium]